MKGLLKLITLLAFFLTACGGSSGDGGTIVPPIVKSKTAGVVQLGPIKNAQVDIISLDGIIRFYTTTADQQGQFDIDRGELKKAINRENTKPDYLKVVATGGIDIDPDDDGVQKASDFKDLKGSVVGIMSVNALLTNDKVAINLITTAVADLLKGKENITAKDIEAILTNLNMEDINKDGKVDNADAIGYDMVQHESGAESKLRYQYLNLIHDGDVENKQNYVEALQEETSYIVRSEQERNGKLLITLKSLNPNNYIRYGINISNDSLLQTVYQSETITLNSEDSLYYEECKSDNSCYHREFVYYNGQKTTTYYPIPYIGNVYSDPQKIAQLRLDYLQKRYYFLHPDEYKAQFTEDINDAKSKLSVLEQSLVDNKNKIEALGGTVN